MRAVLRFVPFALLAVGACGRSEADRSRPRHLILVTIDTLRADHLSCYGYGRATTAPGAAPGFTVDELAAQGMRFENAFAPRGMTLPSMATLFTGKPPIETCVLDNRNALPTTAVTLAERLKEAGFKTAAFSANRLLAPGSGFEKGFDTFFQDSSDDRDLRAVEAAEEWIAAQDASGGSRLFLWLHLVGPHLPYAPAPLDGIDFADRYTDPAYAGAADGSREFLDAAYTQGRALSPAEIAHVIALYDGEVARIGHLVGRFVAFCSGADARQPADLLSASLLVFAADHGEELSERSRYFGHAKSLYDSVLHVPLVLRHPASLGAGRVLPDLVGLEDVLPTVLDLEGLPPLAGIRGRSLASLARGSRSLAAAPAYGVWRDKMFTVRSGRWRLVWNPDHAVSDDVPPGPYPVPEVALFDDASDPREARDVSLDHPDVVHDLELSIRRWLSGLQPCGASTRGPTPAQIQAMKDLGYVEGDR